MLNIVSRPSPIRPAARPILKWVGGKTRLLPHLVPLYEGQRRIVEPFFGGGSFSFHLSATDPSISVVANDLLVPLMDIYRAVRADVEGFISAVEEYAGPYVALEGKAARKEFYYQVRQDYLEEKIDGPVPLFFMLRCAYSGMYRTAKRYPGRFHTPHGMGEEKPGFYFPERLRQASSLMSNWELLSTNFQDVLEHVTADSFVLLDPPYRGTYAGYTGEGFGEEEQLAVVEFFKESARRGAKVAYCNKELGDDFYREHFGGFEIKHIPIKYQVNGNGHLVGRPETLEVLIHN